MLRQLRARIVHGGREQGLTLPELLIVLLIIAILLGIAVPSTLAHRNRGNDAVASANVRQASLAAKTYFQDESTYAGITLDGLRAAYDQSLPAELAFSDLTAEGYCIESTVGGRTWRQDGPGAPIERAAC